MNILFMCVANSARSQLAEGLARNMLPNVEVMSAGSKPGKLNPFAVAVMNEAGMDISKQFAKSFDQLPEGFVANLDFVITLCAEEVCPRIDSKAKKLHWPLKDPASIEPIPEAESLKRFREARGQIEALLSQFKAEIAR